MVLHTDKGFDLSIDGYVNVEDISDTISPDLRRLAGELPIFTSQIRGTDDPDHAWGHATTLVRRLNQIAEEIDRDLMHVVWETSSDRVPEAAIFEQLGYERRQFTDHLGKPRDPVYLVQTYRPVGTPHLGSD